MVTNGPAIGSGRERVFIAVPVAELRLDSAVGFDIYVETQSGYSNYLRAGTEISGAMVRGLTTTGIERLYVSMAEAGKYTAYAAEQARAVLADALATPGMKAEALRSAAVAAARQMAEEPDAAAIQAARRIVELTVAEVLGSPDSLAALLKITYVSYRLHAHMVNCCVYALAMCQPLKIRNPKEISTIGTAGLLFDIGLAGFGRGGRFGAAALVVESDEGLREHPAGGRDLLGEVPGMPRAVLEAALHHHERWDGGGYPAGLRGARIPLAARVAAVVDGFDARMTSELEGSGRGSFAVLKQMRDGDQGRYDPEVLRALIVGLGTGT